MPVLSVDSKPLLLVSPTRCDISLRRENVYVSLLNGVLRKGNTSWSIYFLALPPLDACPDSALTSPLLQEALHSSMFCFLVDLLCMCGYIDIYIGRHSKAGLSSSIVKNICAFPPVRHRADLHVPLCMAAGVWRVDHMYVSSV